MKLLFVFGTRPEAIKLAPVIKDLSVRPNFHCKVCVTGQHRELLAQVLELFALRPDWNLEIMRPDQNLAYLTGAALSGIGEILGSFRPDRVIVQGDTTTTFAGALAAFYHSSSAMSPIFTSPPRRGRGTICCAKGSATNESSSPAIPGSTRCSGCLLCWRRAKSCERAPRRCLPSIAGTDD